mgnify:CR=1 FL=1
MWPASCCTASVNQLLSPKPIRLALRRTLCALVAGLAPAARSELVDAAQARRAAEQWLTRSAIFRWAGGRAIASLAPLDLDGDGTTDAYRAALRPAGYLLLAADNRLPPILACSADQPLNLTRSPQNALRALLDADLGRAHAALRRLDNARGSPIEGATAARHQSVWHELANPLPPASTQRVTMAEDPPGTILVPPLLSSTWSQWNHYNRAYPPDPLPGQGYDGRAPVGCVALAGAQLARFYAWPPRGRDGYVDVDSNTNNLIAGAFLETFAAPFAWSAMQDAYDPWNAEPEEAVLAVSSLIYSLGVAADLDFGSFASGGSSAELTDLNRALNRYFFYEPGAVAARPGNEADFDQRLRNEVLAARPVVAGLPGHAVVVDGLAEEADGDYYHLNYGWGGINNGWYRLDDIAGSSLSEAVFGLQPAFVPLLEGLGTVTNRSGAVALAWSLPAARQPAVQRYRLREGVFAAADFTDGAAAFDAWHNFGGGWTLDADGDNPVFRKNGELGRFELVTREFFRAHAGARLSFRYRACLEDDRFRVKLSRDRGLSWTTLREYTATGWDTRWYSVELDLQANGGEELLLAFEYSFHGGYYYGTYGAVWLDDVALRGVDRLTWTTLADDLDAPACAVGFRPDGVYHFAVEAFDGALASEPSPPQTVVVALDPDQDGDGDGLPNGWESEHFGSPTGAVAEADADGDGSSNASEYGAGTSPTNAADRLALRVEEATPEGYTLRWPSVAGKRYTVLRAAQLAGAAPFAPLATGIAATPPENRFVDSVAPTLPSAFYRLAVERP